MNFTFIILITLISCSFQSRAQINYSADTTFGALELLPVSLRDIGNEEYVYETYSKSNGSILIQGISYDTANYELSYIAFAEFYSDGTSNSAFGYDGILKVPDTITYHGFVLQRFEFIKYDENGGIYVFLDDMDPQVNYSMGSTIIKYTTSGLPDASFGINGRVSYQGVDTLVRSITGTNLPGGGAAAFCVVANDYEDNTDDELLIIKYNAAGIPDSDFDMDGFLMMGSTQSYGVPRNIISLVDGSLLLFTELYDQSLGENILKILKLNENGTFDLQWSDDGMVNVPFMNDGNRMFYYDLNYEENSLFVSARFFDPIPLAMQIAQIDMLQGELIDDFGIQGILSISGNAIQDQMLATGMNNDGELVSIVQRYNDFMLYTFNSEGGYSEDTLSCTLVHLDPVDSSYFYVQYPTSFDYDDSDCLYVSLWINGIGDLNIPGSNVASQDFCISKFCPAQVIESVNNVQLASDDIICYPNPTSVQLYVSSHFVLNNLKLIDVMGNTVLEVKSNAENFIRIDTQVLPSGLYFLVTDTGISRAVVIQ